MQRFRWATPYDSGQFGYMKNNDAVEGVILMRVGEQAQLVLKRLEALTKDLNEHFLPKDVKILPYYDRTTLIDETTTTVEHAAGAGSVRHLSVQYSDRDYCRGNHSVRNMLMFAFICLDWRHIPANLLSIGAIDFGILVDGAVVMVENIFRELAERSGEEYDLVGDSRRGEGRGATYFYAVAVIIAELPADLRAGGSFGKTLSSRWRTR